MSHGIGALFCFVLLRKARRRCCAKLLSTLPLWKGFFGSRTTVRFAPRKKTFRAALGSKPSMAFMRSMTSMGAPTSFTYDIRTDPGVPEEDAEHHRREGAA